MTQTPTFLDVKLENSQLKAEVEKLTDTVLKCRAEMGKRDAEITKLQGFINTQRENLGVQDAEIKRLRRHKQDLNKTIILMRTQLEKRTACLVEAVGLAQESIMPFPNHYNCWRVALGWEPTQVEEK